MARWSGSVRCADAFAEAAVVWAAGGRGQPLVDAAAEALAAGVDSPTLRQLAGAPRASADEEAQDLAPKVFEELGLVIHDRLSSQAVVAGARQLARQFLNSRLPARELARDLYRMYVAAGYPEVLANWSGIDDYYDMLESGVIAGRIDDADKAAMEEARVLAEG